MPMEVPRVFSGQMKAGFRIISSHLGRRKPANEFLPVAETWFSPRARDEAREQDSHRWCETKFKRY